MDKQKHIVKEGSREHILNYDERGVHCSEPNCEVNMDKQMSVDEAREEVNNVSQSNIFNDKGN